MIKLAKEVLMDHFRNEEWFLYLDHSMQDLVIQAHELLFREKKEGRNFHDYSFVVFPMAKAYEGFLKKILVELKLAGEQTVYSRHFRIGKSLNPDLPIKYRREDWLYGKLDENFDGNGDDNLALALWEVWQDGRNRLFHFFPDHKQFISLVDAEKMINRMVGVMERVVRY